MDLAKYFAVPTKASGGDVGAVLNKSGEVVNKAGEAVKKALPI